MPLFTRCISSHKKSLVNYQPIPVDTKPSTSVDMPNPSKDINGTNYEVTPTNQETFLTDNNQYYLPETTKLLTPATSEPPVAKHSSLPLSTRVVKTVEDIKPFEHVFPSKKHKKTAIYIYDILSNKIDCRSWNKISQWGVKLYRKTTSKVTFLNPRITSNAVFENYINTLDPHRLHFTKNDIECFQQHESNFLHYIQAGNLKLGFEMFCRVMDRKLHKIAFLLLELEKGLDNNKLTTNEIIDFDRKEAPWLENSEQAEYWLNYLYKDIMLLQLDGYGNTEIANKLTEKYKNEVLKIAAYQADDAFEYLMNSMVKLEYRAGYSSPKSYKGYKELMHATKLGAGMKTKKHRYGFQITKIYDGSLAAKSEHLKENQVIKSLAFDNSKHFNDTTKMHELGLDDAYLRGCKSVKLEVIADILEPDKTFICELALEKVALAEDRVSSEMIEILHEHSNTKYKIGVIKVPSFYQATIAKDKLSGASEDVTSIINNLDFSEVSDGLIIDLRDNPGGSADQLEKIISIFLENYYKYYADCIGENKLESRLTYNKNKSKITYNKPIICLVNNYSGSASDRLASAIQFFQRGLVVGEQTFGKGVGRFPINVGCGTLTRIIYTMHNPMGKSYNAIGITPDVFIPNIRGSNNYSEALVPHSKTFDDIIVSEPFAVEKFPVDLLDELNDQSYARKKENPIFTYIEQINEFKRSIPDTLQIPLNKDLMQQQKQQRDTEELSIVNQLLQNTNRSMVASLKEANELYDFEKEASRSVLMEAAHILADELASSHKHES
jgi:carboxyl-terminal processing protease